MYDAVIIGSGIGGLTCGAFLARSGMRVLVLERHSAIGGYAHAFRRRSYVFDSGIHSVPMAEGGVVRGMLERLGVNHVIETVEHPSMFSIVTPSSRFTLPARADEAMDALRDRCPGQRAGLDRLFGDARRVFGELAQAGYDFEDGVPAGGESIAARLHGRAFATYLDEVLGGGEAQALIGSLWPYVGMSAERASRMFYLMMFAAHLFDGSHYVRGGFARLADALATAIRNSGGEVLTRREVVSLDIDNGLVRAAVADDGTRYEARLFVSNGSPYLLHGSLIPEPHRSKRWLRRLDTLNPSLSAVGVYLGVTGRVAELLPSCVTLWSASTDHDRIYRAAAKHRSLDTGQLILLRAPDLGDSPTVLLMQFLPHAASSDWKTDKLRVAEQMLARAETIVPGLRDEIRLMEVGSPSTYARYSLNTAGALYGFENPASRYGEARMPIRTHLENLFQVGHWQRPGGGIWNVTVNGFAVSRRILGAFG